MIKAEEASGNAPKQSEFYTVSGKIKNGEKLTDRDGEVLSYYGLDGVGMLYKRLGIQKNSANDQYLQSLILNESLIDAQLNGKSFILTPYGLQPINPTEFVTPKGSKARANTREFLRKRLELDIQISRLKSLDTKNLSESELLRHKDSIAKKQQELKEYVEGGKLYDNTQSEIQGAAITAYEKDLKQADPSKGEVIEESTPDSFQKRYDESGFAKKDVKQTIAFTDKEGNKVINREFALEVRDFTPLTHEIPHSILKDSFKDAEGNVTAEGVEMIDGVLSKLTPVQTKTLKQELASRYNIDPESKELWYEENITVLAELMKRGEITFTKSLGEGLAGLVPAFKKLLPNIEVDAETGKGIFEMLKAQDLSRVNITETETKDKSETKAAKLSKAKESETVLQAIDNLIPSNLKTKAEFDKWAQSEKGGKVIADALQPGGAINNYIRSRGTREESDKMLDDVLFRVYNFNPEAKRKDGSTVGPEAFGEKIFADTAWAKVTARTKLFEEGEKKKLEKRQDDSTLQLIDESTSPSKKADDKLAKKPSETIKYKSEALENLGITEKEYEANEVAELKKELAKLSSKENERRNEIEERIEEIEKNAIENKISEVITEAYEGKDITRFKQTANIPEAVAKLYADMFGITTAAGIKALRVKAQNFPEGDAGGVTRARQFLIDNAAADFARIPRTKDDFVKAGRAGGTGVYQTKLGKALYNKNGKLTGSLKDYIDIISGKNVTINGIEFNALVKGKKLPIYRDAQHIKAALDFHIRNRVLETLEPVQGKRIQMGAKFSEPKKTKAELKRIKFNNEKENKSGSAALDFVVKAEALADFRTNTEVKAEAMISAAAIAAKKLGAFGVDKFFMPGNWTPGTKLSTVFRGGFNVISDVNKIKDPKAKKEALDMIANKELVDLADVIRKSKKDIEVLEKEFIEAFKVAAGAKSGVQARKNAERKDLHDKGVSQTIDIELEMFLESEIGEALVREMLHNSKLNKNLNRNQALPTSYEDGTIINGKRKEDTVDEHQYQAIEHAQTKIKLFKAIKNAKGEKQKEIAKLALDFYKKWIAENYTQFLLKNETDIISGNLKNSKGEIWNKSGSNSHPLLKQKINDFIDLANKKGTTKEQLEKAFNEIPSADIRYFSDFGYVNPNFINTFSKDGSSRTKAQQYNVEVDNKWKNNPYVITQQGKIIEAQILTKAGILKGTEAVDGKKAKELMKIVIELAPGETKAAKLANEILPKQIQYNKPIPVEKGIAALIKTDLALDNGRKLNAPVKKIRVLDFDDTVGVTKSNVLYTMPDGKTGKIDAATFAKEAGRMEAEGAQWDFSEFSKVMEGKKGPLFEVMKTIFDKRGGKDLFILTARPSDAAGPIKEFLESLGVNIPIENITGLGDGTPQAKAGWIMGKAAEVITIFILQMITWVC